MNVPSEPNDALPGAELRVRSPHRLERLRRYTSFLDDGIRIPGTKIRFGFDPVLGLVPGLGDAIGAALSVAIIWEAAQSGVPRSTLLKMAFNVAMDAGLGTIPVLGDLFDAIWKANRSNLQLLDQSLGVEAPQRTSGRGLAVLLVGLLIFCLAIAIGVGWLAVRLITWLTTGLA